MKIYYDYTLEQLTTTSVNVLVSSSATIHKERRVIGKSRKSYTNSNLGVSKLSEELPEEYANAVFAIWGDKPKVTDPPEGGV